MLVVIEIQVISRGFSLVRVARSLVFCVVFCWLLFVILSFFYCPLCCLFFLDLRLLITSLVSLKFLTSDITFTWGLCTKHRQQCKKVTRRDDTYRFSNYFIFGDCVISINRNYFLLSIYWLDNFLIRLYKWFEIISL